MLLAHAENDKVIASWHSRRLFESLLAPNGTSIHGTEVHEAEYPGWATIRYAEVNDLARVWVELKSGGHNGVGWSEGVLDLMASVAEL